ncbi:MAG TPA: CoA-binding protein, partial [Ramlibacter sp.]|nr:CoA-binding protein [Ramlibacter sp.]
MNDLDPFFNPSAVAIIGASSDPERIGGRPLRFLREAGFRQPVYAVNKSGGEVQGLPAYPSILDVPGAVDHAVVCVPVPAVKAAVDECIRKGVRCIQVLTAGFAELGPEGRALQDEILALCRAAGVRLLGPNALGLLNVATGLHATFSTLLDGAKPQPGPIALATQSGAFGSCAYGMATLRGLGFSKIVATGNEADVDVAECIDYLADDPATRVILAALESCRDGDRLRRALVKAARAGKPVIVMKVGRTDLGAAAASTHTGSLAGNDAVYDTVFAECGAWRAQSIEEMLDVAYLCAVTGALPPGDAMGVVTGSGGIGVLMADHAGELGLTMPPLPQAAVQATRELLPFAVAANPLDMTAQVTSVKRGVPRTLEVMLRHGGYDSVLAYLAHSGLSPQRFEATLPELQALRRKYPGQLLLLV